MRFPKVLAVSEATATTGDERAFFGRVAKRHGSSYYTASDEWLYVRVRVKAVRLAPRRTKRKARRR